MYKRFVLTRINHNTVIVIVSSYTIVNIGQLKRVISMEFLETDNV
jgi:hypothetical protein